MAIFKAEGAVLGIRKTPYELKDDQTGETRKGESWRLLVHDPDAMIVNEYAIADDADKRAAFEEIPAGTVIRLQVDVRAMNARGGGAVLSMKALNFTY